MGAHRLPVIRNLADCRDVQTCVAFGIAQGFHNRAKGRLAGIAR